MIHTLLELCVNGGAPTLAAGWHINVHYVKFFPSAHTKSVKLNIWICEWGIYGLNVWQS